MPNIPGIKNALFVGREAEGFGKEIGVLTLFVSDLNVDILDLCEAIESLDKQGCEKLYLGAGGSRRLPAFFNHRESVIKLMNLLNLLEWEVVCEINAKYCDEYSNSGIITFCEMGGRFYLYIHPTFYKGLTRVKTDFDDRTDYFGVDTSYSNHTMFADNLYLGDSTYVARSKKKESKS